MAWSIFSHGGNKAAAQWAVDLLTMLGAKRTQSNVDFIYSWMKAEGGGGKYNPLNQGPVPGHHNLTSTGQQFGGGAADFVSYKAGLEGAAAYLNMHNYRGILSALRKGNGGAARAALIRSPWAASHYNGGRSFPSAHVSASWVRMSPTKHFSGSGSMKLPGPGGATKNVTPHLSMGDLQHRYGFTASMLKADASLNKMFHSAVSGQWTDARFQAGLMGTSWWRKQTDVGRQYWLKRFTDPATATAQYSQHQADVNALASQYGISMFTSAHQRHLVDIATNAVITKGWNDNQVNNYFASNLGNLKNGQMYGGKLGEYQTQLIDAGFKNGVKTDAAYLNPWIHKLAMGTASIEQAENDIRLKASHQYSAYKTQLMAGQNLIDIASPYIKSASTLLERPESSFDLFNPLIKNNLQWRDPQASGKPPQAVPLWQFEHTVRQDPRWKQTNNARDAAMTNVHKVLTDFGIQF